MCRRDNDILQGGYQINENICIQKENKHCVCTNVYFCCNCFFSGLFERNHADYILKYIPNHDNQIVMVANNI